MPLYHYHCGGSCEEFAKMRRISECALPEECPTCRRTAHRVLKAPSLNTMAKNSRIAHQRNESSADSPKVEKRLANSAPTNRGHHSGHGHSPSRPWMLGH